VFGSEPSLLSAPPRAQSSDPRIITILVVDDDPTVGPWVGAALEPVGYAVLHTIDPLEAIRMGKNRPGDIDLLLVDVVMPLMDGRKLAMYAHVRAQGFTPEAPARDASWGERYFHLTDPDGNALSFARPLRNADG
jgi:hypothetical protein